MKKFTSVQEAFGWWLKNVYPDLPADRKKGKLTDAWRNYTFKKSVSEAKMIEILKEFGEIQIRIEVLYQPK